MRKRYWITIILLLALWLISAEIVDNPIKLPSLWDVIQTMISQAFSFSFYKAFAYTIWRGLSGLMIAGVCGLGLGMLSGLNPKFEAYFAPIYLILKSIPNISYILIVLIWTSNDFAVKTISFMIIFPMVYINILTGMKSLDKDLMDVLKLYPQGLFTEITRVYLPLLSSFILASVSNGLGLAFKVGIMAEIIGSVSPGIGRLFQIYRINVDMVSTFALTIWVIGLLGLIEAITRYIKLKIKQKS